MGKPDLIIPPNITNGSDYERLCAYTLDTVESLREALGDLQEVRPHRRDYQEAEPGIFALASSQHVSREHRIQSVIDELTEILGAMDLRRG